MNKYLEHLKQDTLVYYIYQSDFSIYNIPTTNSSYIVIVDRNYVVPKEFKQYKYPSYDWKPIKFGINCEGDNFEFFEMQEWFKYVLNCDIKAWECSCLPRKFIHKEHVKLLLETDLLKLRKNFDNSLDPYIIKVVSDLNLGKFEEAKLTLFSLLKSLIFTKLIVIIPLSIARFIILSFIKASNIEGKSVKISILTLIPPNSLKLFFYYQD